jgi:hypothetical protein
MLGQTLRVSLNHKTGKKKAARHYSPLTLSFRNTAQQRAEFSLWHFYLWRHLQVYTAPIENEQTLHQRIFHACQTIRSRP